VPADGLVAGRFWIFVLLFGLEAVHGLLLFALEALLLTD